MPTVAPTDSVSPPRIAKKRCFCILTFVCFGFMLQGAGESHLTSFLDVYALEEKALSPTQYGIIMGSYCLVMVVGSPLTAKLVTLKYFQDKTLMPIGWNIDATFTLLLSFAYKLERGNPFFIGCLVLRSLQASGCAIGFIMPYVITGLEMNEYNHIIIPVLQTIYGTSVVAGPAFSGLLYDLGGFPMPFRILGGILMFWMILAMALFPKAQTENQKKGTTEDFNVWSAFEFPVFVNVLCAVSVYASISSNESTLALQLNTMFGMNATDAGLAFLYPGGFYAVSCLLLGFLSKRVSDPRYLILLGQILSLVALSLQGPLIPIEQTKVTFLFAQALFGIGAGPSLVCGYLHSLRCVSKGNETKEVHAALSAIFIPASFIGGAVGPLFAGIIRHHYSYAGIVTANALQIALTAMLLFITTCLTTNRSKNAGRI